MSAPGPVYELIGKIAYAFTEVQPLLPTYSHLLVSALFPIYAGAHSSLTRPSSAAKPKKAAKPDTQEDGEETDLEEEDEDDTQRMEGLSPSDALVFPLMAGVTLAGLYFLIKWLKDPALLNKILNLYFAVFGIFSVARFITDGMDLAHGVIFPRRYTQGRVLYQVHTRARVAAPKTPLQPYEKYVKTSPLPGVLSRLPLPASVKGLLWNMRNIPRQKWTVKVFLRGFAPVRGHIGLHGVLGFLLGLAAVAYFNFVDKPWFLTNLIGFAFSYGALQLMSPTTFSTGTLLLSALFFYDIYMVFFTPMMVTVAKSLDIPIKLVFPRPDIPSADPSQAPIKQHAMLGLGDVVLPGIMIGLSLRFDLYMFYLRKQIATTLSPAAEPNKEPAVDDSADPSAEPASTMQVQVNKAAYVSVSNRWGEYIWARSASQSFPKPYFKATMIGYVIGMLTTLAAMQIANHAQPALLYLVPGVLVSAWGTALIRGELKEMREFSEAAEEEESDGERAKSKDGKKAEKLGEKSILSAEKTKRMEQRLEKAMGKYVEVGPDDGDKEDAAVSSPKARRLHSPGHDHDRDVFSFAITAPFSVSKEAVGSSGEDKKRADDGRAEKRRRTG